MKTMRWVRVGFWTMAGICTAQSAVSPEDLLAAFDQMTPEQVYELEQKLEAKLWQPIPEGFFTRMAIEFGGSYAELDTVDLSSVTLSGGNMDVSEAAGPSFGLFWRMRNERFRLGLRADAWSATDSNLSDEGYSRADLDGGTISLAAQYQWIRSDRWLMWTELAPGIGFVVLDTVDTPAGQATTLRRFDGTFTHVSVQGGVAWRMNPVLSLMVSGGYRFAESVTLDEGGRSTRVDVDPSGFSSRFGIGLNF